METKESKRGAVGQGKVIVHPRMTVDRHTFIGLSITCNLVYLFIYSFLFSSATALSKAVSLFKYLLRLSG